MVADVTKLLPQNVEAEAGVLGSLLISPDALIEISDFLRAEMFYREAHRAIFQAALDLHANGQPADLITLTDELARTGRLEEVGGISHVSSLANQVPTSRNVAQYARIVERCFVLRRLIHAAGQIAAIAYNEPDAEDALAESERQLAAVSMARVEPNTPEAVSAILSPYLDEVELLGKRERGQILGLSTGYQDLDRMTGGLRGGEVYLIAARPGVGKTNFALNLARNAGHAGKRTLIFSLEMSKRQLLERLLAMQAGVDSSHLRNARLSEHEWDAIAEASGPLAAMGIVVDDTPGLRLDALRAKARRLRRAQPFDLLIVDYLQLMRVTDERGREYDDRDRVAKMTAISQGIKRIAREMDLPVVAVSQLSRDVEKRTDKKPQPSDLRDSGSLEQDATALFMLYRDEIYNPDTDRQHIADVHVPKNRHGPLGVVALYADMATGRFRDLHLVTARDVDVAPAYGMDDEENDA